MGRRRWGWRIKRFVGTEVPDIYDIHGEQGKAAPRKNTPRWLEGLDGTDVGLLKSAAGCGAGFLIINLLNPLNHTLLICRRHRLYDIGMVLLGMFEYVLLQFLCRISTQGNSTVAFARKFETISGHHEKASLLICGIPSF
jgi:hypothetical protein